MSSAHEPETEAPRPRSTDAGPGLESERAAVRACLAMAGRGKPLPAADAVAVASSLQAALPESGAAALLQLPLPDMSDYITVHALNVAALAMALARELGRDEEEVRDLGVAGLLHDVGMATVPLALLCKAEQLDEAERALVKQHAAAGAALIVAAEPALPLAAVVAYEHHLRVDGGGYPRPRQARPAQHASRLVQLCDVYDALRTPRPFRQAWPEEIIRSFISSRAGVEFDPELARVFLGLLQREERA